MNIMTEDQQIASYTFKNRDESWLRFNARVLQEAMNPEVPLYERIKFLAIFSSNLDEFFSVRVSALRQFKQIRKVDRKKYNIKPNKRLKIIYAEVHRQQETFGKIVSEQIVPDLHSIGIKLVTNNTITPELREKAIAYFESNIQSLINVEYIERINEPPFLKNNQLYIAFKTIAGKVGLVQIPTSDLSRFIHLKDIEDEVTYIFLEDSIMFGLQAVESDILEMGVIKLSRDAETYIEDEFSGDLIEKIKQAIADRGRGIPTRLLFDASMSSDFLDEIKSLFSLSKSDLIEGGRYHNFKDFFSFPTEYIDERCFYPPMNPLPHPKLSTTLNVLSHVQASDEIVHFPYQDFDVIPRLLREAAQSIDVRHIKMTLYRISKTSEVAKALLFALEQGKEVTVFIEVKARFDEENNLMWGQILREKGANVIYSYPGIKIHSKIVLIRMNEKASLVDVAYIGTGNFNEKTARVYCDHGLITSHKKITGELDQVFRILTGRMIVPKAKHLLISPFNTRQKFLDLLQFEINEARAGRKASVVMKMNSLEDRLMIERLYEANNSGVQIRLLVRGFCCLIPGVVGMSENIYATSIIDRYLEHARIYSFNHAGEHVMYIGSADWMTRNLDRRIEVCVPIYDSKIKKELTDILNIQINDNQKARIIDAEERNNFVEYGNDDEQVRAQFDIHEYLKVL